LISNAEVQKSPVNTISNYNRIKKIQNTHKVLTTASSQQEDTHNMNFYPQRDDDGEIVSLESADMQEECNVVVNECIDSRPGCKSPVPAHDEVQSIPEYYFDLTNGGNSLLKIA